MADDRLILATSLNYWRYATVGAPGSEIRPLPMTWNWQRKRSGDEFQVAGWWGRMGRTPAAVFVRNGELRVAVGRQEWPLDERLQALRSRKGRNAELRMVRDGDLVARGTYRTPRRPRQHWLDWPLDEEDYDFGAFIARMAVRRTEAPPLESVWPFTRRLPAGETAA